MRLCGTETSVYTCDLKNEAEGSGGPDDNALFLTDVLADGTTAKLLLHN